MGPPMIVCNRVKCFTVQRLILYTIYEYSMSMLPMNKLSPGRRCSVYMYVLHTVHTVCM